MLNSSIYNSNMHHHHNNINSINNNINNINNNISNSIISRAWRLVQTSRGRGTRINHSSIRQRHFSSFSSKWVSLVRPLRCSSSSSLVTPLVVGSPSDHRHLVVSTRVQERIGRVGSSSSSGHSNLSGVNNPCSNSSIRVIRVTRVMVET